VAWKVRDLHCFHIEECAQTSDPVSSYKYFQGKTQINLNILQAEEMFPKV